MKYVAGLMLATLCLGFVYIVSQSGTAIAADRDLSSEIDELKGLVARLQQEVEALKKGSVDTAPQFQFSPRPFQQPLWQKRSNYPWEPYYDGFAFEPKAHFLADTK